MAQPAPTGESKAPLVVALAFFILTTVALGIVAYQAYDEKAQMKGQVKDAEDRMTAAISARSVDQQRTYVYKTFLAVQTADELKALQENGQNRNELYKEYEGLIAAVNDRLKALNADQGQWAAQAKAMNIPDGNAPNVNVVAGDAFEWKWAGAKMDDLGPPKLDILKGLVNAVGQKQLATERLKVDQAAMAQAVKKAEEDSKLAKDAQAKYTAEAAKFPAQVAAINDKAVADVARVRADYTDKTNKQETAVKTAREESGAKDVTIGELKTQLAGAKELVARLESQLTSRENPFEFDKPHGKVVRRDGTTVTIDLGSADNVRPGLTFMVQPFNTAQIGLQARMKPRLGPTGKPLYENDRPVMDVVPKGTIEVTEVLGPNVSLARITSQADPIRDAVLVGDVLYNSAWRKGAADHVALFGVMDVDGDGIDDIKAVARDLTKMGVTVDAYFDLETRKWVGKVTEQTAYAVEGYYPVSAGGDALAPAKAVLDQALRDARQQAREKGAKVVKMRDFFPRTGYKMKFDVSADRINQAYARYLQVDAPPAPPPGN